jgi:hypothetical protein
LAGNFSSRLYGGLEDKGLPAVPVAGRHIEASLYPIFVFFMFSNFRLPREMNHHILLGRFSDCVFSLVF